MREKGLGEGKSGFMAFLNTVELMHVKDKLYVICVIQLVKNQDDSWVKIEWREECRASVEKLLCPVCILTAKWLEDY